MMLRLGKQGLVGVIVVNIILVSCFGALIIPLFGFSTNAGNVFYAAIFLAAQVMTEQYGRKAALRSVWVGFGALVLFVLMAQYTVRLVGGPGTEQFVASIHTIFAAIPRIALASIIAYLVSQNLNVWLFSMLKKQSGKKQLWLRGLVSSSLGQLVDSVLFFSIAFGHTIPNKQLLQIMVVGFAVKLFVCLLGIPILYASYPVLRVASGDGERVQE
jgi:uncharacterized integral membrane protein (TIGR00697 family)